MDLDEFGQNNKHIAVVFTDGKFNGIHKISQQKYNCSPKDYHTFEIDDPEVIKEYLGKVAELVPKRFIELNDQDIETLNDIFNLVDYGLENRMTLFGELEPEVLENLKKKIKR